MAFNPPNPPMTFWERVNIGLLLLIIGGFVMSIVSTFNSHWGPAVGYGLLTILAFLVFRYLPYR